MTQIAERSPVCRFFYQNIVFGPPFNFEPPVLSGKGPGNRNANPLLSQSWRKLLISRFILTSD
jgi:hypothetical protein